MRSRRREGTKRNGAQTAGTPVRAERSPAYAEQSCERATVSVVGAKCGDAQGERNRPADAEPGRERASVSAVRAKRGHTRKAGKRSARGARRNAGRPGPVRRRSVRRRLPRGKAVRRLPRPIAARPPEAGAGRLASRAAENPAELYRFWVRLYRAAIPNLPALVRLIDRLADRWVTADSLRDALKPFVRPFYYDDPASVLDKRVFAMMVHLGMLRIGEDGDGRTVLKMTNAGRKMITGSGNRDFEPIVAG